MTNNNTNQASTGGISFAGILTIVFVVLKLTHLINWSWWWVLSPIWIPFGLGIALVILAIIVAAIFAVIKERR